MRLTAPSRASRSNASSSEPGRLAPRGHFPEEVILAPFPSRRRSVPRPLRDSAPVMAVGQRVFVNSTSDPSGSVALGDESGKGFAAVHLADGVEVEVIAWRPGGASGA